MPELCPACIAARNRWADSTPSSVLPRAGFTFGAGTAYDSSAAGIRDNRRARYERWRGLVKAQMAGIAELCRAGRHAEVDTSPS